MKDPPTGKKQLLENAAARIPVALLAVAVWLRLYQYLGARSLWADEAHLAINIFRRSFGELVGPLYQDQAAPILFLWATKLSTLAFGKTEMALRLLPFLASVAGCVLFYLLAKKLLSGAALVAALFAYALSPPLVYFAQEFKQYSVDVAVAVGLVHAFCSSDPGVPGNRRKYLWLGAAGAIAIWLSHASVFVLAGIGTLVLWRVLRRQFGIPLGQALVVPAAWGVSFALNYFVSLRHVSSNEVLHEFWSEGFLPLPTSMQDLRACLAIAGGLARYGGYDDRWHVFVAFMLCLPLLVPCRRTRVPVFCMTAIVAWATLASVLHAYPLQQRLALFLLPFLYLSCALGLSALSRATSRAVGGLAFFLLVAPFLKQAGQLATQRMTRHEIRSVIERLQQRREDGEAIYVCRGAQNPVRAYQIMLGLPEDWCDFGVRVPDGATAIPDLAETAAKEKVWFLWAHRKGAIERDRYLPGVEAKVIEKIQEPGADAWLVDFRLNDAPDRTDGRSAE